MENKRKLLITSLVVFLLIIAGANIIKEYRAFRYLKSADLELSIIYLEHSAKAYLSTYCEYPANGKAFLDFLKRNDFYYNHAGEGLPDLFLEDDTEIKVVNSDSSFTLYQDKSKENCSKVLITPDSLSFMQFLFSDYNLRFFNIAKISCCNLSPKRLKLFSDNINVDYEGDTTLHNALHLFITEINSSSKHLNRAKIKFEAYGDNILYLKIRFESNKIAVDTICLPYSMAYGADSVNVDDYIKSLDFGKISNFKIDEIYLPIIFEENGK